ncbi:MAG: hypothetical protein K0R09_988 [Clostridiales bacterium]|jgi:uncharacterized protein YbbK (DUF523 family)|nr:hypothetical protein [Clostridiales bacterium]
MILISACLCGVDCRYSGDSKSNEKIYSLLMDGNVQLVCPEQLGGLPTPRHPAEICQGTSEDVIKGSGKVLNNQGEDVTKHFIKGAEETLKIAKTLGCNKAILKSRSPSCGCGNVYSGNFDGTLVEGNGVTAQLLMENGIEVLTEEDI